MSALVNILAFIVLLGVLVTVHELGHFIVAKLSKVKVEVFSIGFGSPIVRYQLGETEYRISWLPLGGYVRMAGQDPAEPGGGADVEGGFYSKPPWVRILIAAAGPAMNLVLPFLILVPYFAVSGTYDEVPGNRIGAVDRGLPAWQSGLRPGDEILAVDGEPVSAFWQIAERIEAYDPEEGPLEVTVRRPDVAEPLTLEVRPEAVQQTHPLLGYKWTDYRVGYMPDAPAPDVALTDPSSPLAQAGVRTFDRVVSLDGRPVATFDELERRLKALPPGKTTAIEVERDRPVDARFPFLQRRERLAIHFTVPAGEPGAAARGLMHAGPCISSIAPGGAAERAGLRVGDCILTVNGEEHSLAAFVASRLRNAPETPKTLEVLRDGRRHEITLAPEAVVFEDPLAGEVKQWRIGLTLLNRPDQFVTQALVPNDDRLAFSWRKTVDHVGAKLDELLFTVAGLFTGDVSPTQLGGPLTIYTLAGMQAQAGADSFIALMVMLSLSLALLNLLPVPLLDGGQIMIAGIEMVIRRPLPDKVQIGLRWVGQLMVLALILFALGNDLIRQWRLHFG